MGRARLSALDGSALVGHNVHVDTGVLQRKLRNWRPPEVFDTLKLAKRLLPGHPSYKLGALVKALSLDDGMPPGLEPHRVGKHESGAAHGRALGKREQRGENRRARVQNDAAHMGVVEIKHVPHLAVGERRIEPPEFEASAQDGCLRPAAGLLQHREQRIDGLVPAAGERAANPVEHAATGLAPRRRRQVGKLRRREMGA